MIVGWRLDRPTYLLRRRAMLRMGESGILKGNAGLEIGDGQWPDVGEKLKRDKLLDARVPVVLRSPFLLAQ